MPKQVKNEKQSQSERFKEKARELGCDEDEAAFERTLKRIVTPKRRRRPAPEKSKP